MYLSSCLTRVRTQRAQGMLNNKKSIIAYLFIIFHIVGID
jgi:hypothetical protein